MTLDDPEPSESVMPARSKTESQISNNTAQRCWHKKKRYRLCIVGFLGLITLVVTGISLLALSGPIPFPTIAREADRQLENILGTNALADVGEARLSLNEKGLIVVFEGISAERQGMTLLINQLTLDVRTWSLFKGDMQVRSADFNGVKLSLDPGALAGLAVFAEDPSQAVQDDTLDPKIGGLAPLVSALKALDETAMKTEQRLAKGALPEISLTNAELQLGFNADSKRITNIEGHFRMEDGRLSAFLSGDGSKGVWRMSLSREKNEDNLWATHVRLNDLTLPDFIPALKEGEGIMSLDVPVFASLSAATQNGSLVSGGALFEVGAGYLVMQDRHATIMDEARLKLDWNPEDLRFDIADARLYFGQDGGSATGVLTAGQVDGVPGIDLALISQNLTMTDPAKRALPLQNGEMRLHIRHPANKDFIDLQTFSVRYDDVSVQAQGRIVPRSGGALIDLTVSSSAMKARHLRSLWPMPLAPGARKWVIQNIYEGDILPGQASFSLNPADLEILDNGRTRMPQKALTLKAGFENGLVRLPGEMPPVSDIDGSVEVGGRTVLVRGEDGLVRFQSGRIVNADSVEFSVEDHSIQHAPATLSLELFGSAAALTEAASTEPVTIAKERGLDADAVSGQSSAKVVADFRMVPKLTMEDMNVKADIELSSFSSSRPLDGRVIRDADLRITVQGQSAWLRGEAVLDGVRTTIDLREGEDGGYTVQAVLNDADRERLGIELDERLKGPIRVTVLDGDNQGQLYSVDLTDAILAIPEVGWIKPAGKQSQMEFRLLENGSVKRAEDIKLIAPSLTLNGDARLNGEILESLTFKNVVIEDVGTLDFSLTREDGQPVTRIKSSFLKLPLSGLQKAGGGETGRLELNVGRLEVARGSILRGVSLVKESNTNGMTAFDLKAALEDAGEVTGKLETQNGRSGIRLRSDNAGAVFKAAGIYPRMQGGNLNAFLVPESAQSPLRGEVFVDNFRVVNEPAMARLLAKDVSTGPSRDTGDITRLSNGESADNAQFDKLFMRFDRTANILDLQEVIVKGPSIGMNLRGQINYASERIQITGTYIPFYRLNTFFSQIPILGLALGGGKNEGLIGITFEVTGLLNEPVLNINPMSAIAPGVFRKVFEYQ
jgi:hypothetical protein